MSITQHIAIRLTGLVKGTQGRSLLWRIPAATVLCVVSYQVLWYTVFLTMAHRNNALSVGFLLLAQLLSAGLSAVIATVLVSTKMHFASKSDSALTGMLLAAPVPFILMLEGLLIRSATGIRLSGDASIHILPPLNQTIAFLLGGGFGGYLYWLISPQLYRPRLFVITSLVLLVSPIITVAGATMISFPAWERWHRGGAGLRVGMAPEEVVKQLETRSRDVSCNLDNGHFCVHKPAGLARLSLDNLSNGLFYFPFTYRVDLEYGTDMRLRSWAPTKLSD